MPAFLLGKMSPNNPNYAMDWGQRPAKKARTCTACGHVCGFGARTCKGRSALPIACTRSFTYEHQEDKLCAKHAINNLLAMPFVTEDDLNDFASHTSFGGKEDRFTGFAMMTIMDLLTSRGLNVNLLRNNTAHLLPYGEDWAKAITLGLGTIVHSPGHFYAIVCMQDNPP